MDIIANRSRRAMGLIPVLIFFWPPGGTQGMAQAKKPNILVIMGDDVGWFNIGAYHRGIMSGKTPNLDKLAAQACCSPTTTLRPAARRAAPTSSPANFLSAPD